MFEHYLELGGTEIANTARVNAYIEKNAPQIPFRKRQLHGTLHLALGEAEYESPVVDDAPWVDPSNPATARFYGVVPLSITGMDGSTATASTQESIGEGGTTGAERYGSRYIRVRALLVAEDKQALEAGQTWLDSALRPTECDDHGGSCGGGKLCYYSAEPCVVDEWEKDYAAGFLAPVAATAGAPVIIREPNSDAVFKAQLDGPGQPPTTSPDGVVVRWGTVMRDDTDTEVESYGPIIRQRTNLFVRPSFEAPDAATWWVGTYTIVDDASGPGGRAYAETEGIAQNPATAISAPAGPIIVGLDLRSDVVGATVTVTLRDPDDNSALHAATFLVTEDWVRYSMPVPSTGPFYLDITSDDLFGVTGFTVEAGALEFPYLDGDQPWQLAAGTYLAGGTSPEYAVSWLGTPHQSRSRLTWLGAMTVGMPIGSDFIEWKDGICDVWPFVHVLQGEMGGGRGDFAVRPKIQTDVQVRPFERTMHDVRRVEGPTPIRNLPLKAAGAMREVEFTLVANKPWAYSTTETLIHPTVMSTLPTIQWPGVDDCPVETITPIVDPDCPPLPEPPRPPVIPAACIEIPTVLQRYMFAIPSSKVSLWSDMVPRITIISGTQDIRQVRVRAFPNPFDRELDLTAETVEGRAKNPKLGVDATGWGRQGGVGTATGRQSSGGPIAGVIDPFYRVTASGAHGADLFGVTYGGVGTNLVAAGEDYRVTIFGRANVTRPMQLRIGYVNAADVEFSVSMFDVGSRLADVWDQYDTGVQIAPANTVRLNVSVVGQGAGTWSALNTVDATGLAVKVGTAALLTPDYIDGDIAAFAGVYYGWLGDADASVTFGTTLPFDPCSWCSEFILSYLPPKTELTVDAIIESAFASVEGGTSQSAETLLYASDGGPMTWPALSCGIGYIFSVDVPEPLLDDVTISFDLARRE